VGELSQGKKMIWQGLWKYYVTEEVFKHMTLSLCCKSN